MRNAYRRGGGWAGAAATAAAAAVALSLLLLAAQLTQPFIDLPVRKAQGEAGILGTTNRTKGTAITYLW